MDCMQYLGDWMIKVCDNTLIISIFLTTKQGLMLKVRLESWCAGLKRKEMV